MLIFNQANQCLLIKRSKNSKISPGKWDLPGGKIDTGENLEEAMLREVLEETGLLVSIQGLAGATDFELPKIKVIHLILEGRLESGKIHLSSEHDNYIWVDLKEIPRMDLAFKLQSFAQTYFKMKEKQGSSQKES